MWQSVTILHSLDFPNLVVSAQAKEQPASDYKLTLYVTGTLIYT